MLKQKNNLLVILVLTLFIALFIIYHASNNVIKQTTKEKNYWKEKSLVADAVIDTLINHYDDAYIYDVMMETDVWDNYSHLKYDF